MVHRQTTPPGRKFIVLASVIALHAAMIAMLLQQAADIEPKVAATSIAMIAIDAERPVAAKPPPPAIPTKVADTFVPVTELSIPEESESDAPAGSSAACSTADIVREALLKDPRALYAIRTAPPEARSVADAIVIWNEGWSRPALPGAALFIVRTTIEKVLSTVAENCLDEAVTGPRFLPLPDAAGTRTIFLVLGSGNWTWRTILTAQGVIGDDISVTSPANSVGV